MKRFEWLFTVVFIPFIMGCNDEEPQIEDHLSEGFHVVINDEVVIGPNDIEYYDYSTHLIYLKESNTFIDDYKNGGQFAVYANGFEIYNGSIMQSHHAYLPSGPVLNYPSLYGDNNLHIGFIQIHDSSGNPLTDPRIDTKIVEALKKHDKFHPGLKCEIKYVNYASKDNVTVELELKNEDSFNYYYLDPDKMGDELFHYFTNGLYIKDLNSKTSYTNNIDPVELEPWDIWKKEWLSIIESGETKTLSLTYDGFEEVLSGTFKATFNFPGLGGQVSKEDLQQKNGRIWLGKLQVSKDIRIQ